MRQPTQTAPDHHTRQKETERRPAASSRLRGKSSVSGTGGQAGFRAFKLRPCSPGPGIGYLQRPGAHGPSHKPRWNVREVRPVPPRILHRAFDLHHRSANNWGTPWKVHWQFAGSPDRPECPVLAAPAKGKKPPPALPANVRAFRTGPRSRVTKSEIRQGRYEAFARGCAAG